MVLESTDYDTPLDVMAEQHIPSDQPGIIMRRQLAALIKSQAEPQLPLVGAKVENSGAETH